jgi:hypothetical protein
MNIFVENIKSRLISYSNVYLRSLKQTFEIINKSESIDNETKAQANKIAREVIERLQEEIQVIFSVTPPVKPEVAIGEKERGQGKLVLNPTADIPKNMSAANETFMRLNLKRSEDESW